MYTFLFIQSPKGKNSEASLKHWADLTRRWTPSLNASLTESISWLPDVSAGWFYLQPTVDVQYPLISHIINEHYAILAFGVVLPTACSTAQHILNAWLVGGAKGVQDLEGSFSAVIVNRATGTVIFMGDVMGRRRLRYHHARDRDTLLISPHDVSLVATGMVPVEFDDVSAASITVVKWSLGGKSLLRSIQTCHPSECIHYSAGQISQHSLPLINPDERISPRDIQGIQLHQNQLIEAAQSHLQPLKSEPEIKTSLTAGLDSRAVLSLLLSVVDPRQITTFTNGQPNCLDVQVAKKLAHMAGVKHVVMSPDTHTKSFIHNGENLIDYADLLAFYFNGDTTSKYGLIGPLPTFQASNQPYIGGLAAEIFRGFSYRTRLFPNLQPLPHNSIMGVLARERGSSHHLPWNSSELEHAVHKRLESLIGQYSITTANGYDILDLFNIYEVSGVWGATQQHPWNPGPKLSPFSSRRLLKLALRLPAPMGYHARIHQEAIRRYLPEAYWMLVNGQTLPALRSSEFIASYRKKYQRGLRRIGLQRNEAAINSHNPRSLQASVLAGPARQTVCDLILDRDSFSRRIFSLTHLEALLMQEHFPTRTVDTIGSMVTMERWYRLIQKVRQEAKHSSLVLR